MPVAALVAMLHPDVALRRNAIATLLAEPEVTLGEPAGDALPLVTEAPDLPAQDALWTRIENTPGVAALALVRLDFDDVESFDVPARRLRRPRAEE